MATINHKTYNEATETFKDFNVYDGKETLIFKVDGSEGNVGIGTSSPTDTIGYGRALDIQSSTGAVVYLRDSNAPTTQYGFLAFDGSDNGLKLHNANSSGFLRFDTNATEKMRIDSAGNVGIGTPSPDGRLHVLNGSAGSVTANGNADELIVENSSTGGLSILTPDASTGYIMFGSPADNEGAIIRYTPSGTLMTIGTEVANGALAFRTATGTERMRIDSAGNVGIGTSAPDAGSKLTVSGGILTKSNTTAATTGAMALDYLSGSTAGRIIAYGPSATNFGNTFFLRSDGTTTTESMRITSTGNVGIGTSTANTLLSIDGAADNGLSIQGIGTTSTRAFFGLDTSGDGYLSLTNGSSFAKNVQLSSDLSVSNYILGNVGIGTDAPSRKLVVYDTDVNVPTIGLRTDGSGLLTTNGFDLQFANNNTFLANRENGYMSFLTGNVERMRILAAGNVGIGTSAPNVQLEVSAADNSLGGIFRLNNNRTSLFDGDQNGSIQFSNNEVSGGANGVRSAILSLVRDTAGKTDLAFTTASSNAAATEKVRILADGGLTFNGDTAAANALDDYEEGDITFALTFGGGSSGITYARNTGKYTKVGRQVTITGAIELTNKGTDTGNAVLTGLPFAVPNVVANFGSVALSNVRAITFADQIQAYVLINSSTILLNETTNAGAYTQLTDSDFANNSEFIINCSYFV
jgi:hypothetical protein